MFDEAHFARRMSVTFFFKFLDRIKHRQMQLLSICTQSQKTTSQLKQLLFVFAQTFHCNTVVVVDCETIVVLSTSALLLLL